MKVLYVATSYPSDEGDWKGVFIRHLADALAARDDLCLRTWLPPGPLPEQAQSAATKQETQWLKSLMNDGGIAHVMRSGGFDALKRPFDLLRFLRALYRRETAIDVYHLNWLQTALPLPANKTPALITVLGTDLKLLKLPLIKPLLRRVMRQRAVALCPNADWMVEPLKEAFGDVAKVEPIAFGIDPVWYAIKREPDPDQPVWLAVTRLTKDKLGPLFEWSAPLFEGKHRQLHLIGPMQEDIDIPEWVHYHGAASPDVLATKWFPRAHGLITLSRHAEGRPQVMLEAMAAGLPIIASDMPAHGSLVTAGTGFLSRDCQDYRLALEGLEEIDNSKAFGERARCMIRNEVGTWNDCAQRYQRLYEALLVTDLE